MTRSDEDEEDSLSDFEEAISFEDRFLPDIIQVVSTVRDADRVIEKEIEQIQALEADLRDRNTSIRKLDAEIGSRPDEKYREKLRKTVKKIEEIKAKIGRSVPDKDRRHRDQLKLLSTLVKDYKNDITREEKEKRILRSRSRRITHERDHTETALIEKKRYLENLLVVRSERLRWGSPRSFSFALENGSMYFVNRDAAIRALLKLQESMFLSRRRSGHACEIAIIDESSGMGKSTFADNFIRECRWRDSLLTTSFAPEFASAVVKMETFCP